MWHTPGDEHKVSYGICGECRQKEQKKKNDYKPVSKRKL